MLDLVYPPKCPVCRAFVDQHRSWCAKCLGAVIAQREINMAEHRLTALASCRVVCDYSGGVRRLIHDLKFRHASRLAGYLTWLLEHHAVSQSFTGIDAVVPVPLSAERLRQRGYNQTELIFKAWANQQGWNWLEVLERQRSTLPQWELDFRHRRQNIKGAFCVTRPEWSAESIYCWLMIFLQPG